MKTSKLNPLVVSIVGAVLSLIAAGAIIYFMVMPASAAYDAAKSRYDAAYPDSTPAAQAAAKKQVDAANVQVAQIQSKYAVYDRTLMPRYDVSNRYRAWQQITYEQAERLGPDLERWIPKTGVIPESSIAIQPPPVSPNDIQTGTIQLPIGGQNGTVQVGGSFQQILRHFQMWNNYNRLVLADGLALHGNSPYMTANYNAQVIIFPQNSDKAGKTIPAAGTGAAAGGGFPGGFGGPPAGFGGPPPGVGGPRGG